MNLTEVGRDNFYTFHQQPRSKQSKKSSSQLKDTLRNEREENNKLKIKFEDMQKEIRSSKAELQVL